MNNKTEQTQPQVQTTTEHNSFSEDNVSSTMTGFTYKPDTNINMHTEPFSSILQHYFSTLLTGCSYQLTNAEILATFETALRITKLQMAVTQGANSIDNIIERFSDIKSEDLDYFI